ncbi:MAG: hypothetical protein HYV28_18230 [Ignavibacteriales bacterium]|nr:hypothetical protein [Ignavibacteriales bacterium]
MILVKNFSMAILFLFAIVILSGCNKSIGWLEQYVEKEITLEGSGNNRFNGGYDLGKCVIRITNIKVQNDSVQIEYIGDLQKWVKYSSYHGDLYNIYIKALDLDGVNIEASSLILGDRPVEGNKFRGKFTLVATPEKISEIRIGLFVDYDPKVDNSNAVYVFKNRI